MKFPGSIVSVLLVLTLCGCLAPAAQVVTPMPEKTAAATGSAEGGGNVLDEAGLTAPVTDVDGSVNLARLDLAGRLKMDLGQISSLKVSDITWPDIRQGCVQGAGQRLTKGRLNGYRVWLQADGKNYLYHVGLDGRLLFCTD